MLRVDENGWLASDGEAPELVFRPTKRTMRLHVPEVVGVLWHTLDVGTFYDRGKYSGVADELSDRIVELPGEQQRSASWHHLLSAGGVIYVQAPYTRGTWHCKAPVRAAGRSFESANRALIGVELENGGRLRVANGEVRCHPYGSKNVVSGRGAPCYASQGVFEGFPTPLVAAAEALVRALVAWRNWPREAFEHFHGDLEPGRREDPGPIWRENVLPAILDRVYG